MDRLVRLYFDWISNFDPYLAPQEIIESDLPEMLYNLVNIREQGGLEPEDLKSLNEVIAAFEAEGIKYVN